LERVVIRRLTFIVLAVMFFTPAPAAAQATPPAPGANEPPLRTGNKWIVVGGVWTTSLGDCTDCEERKYRHTGSLLSNVGWSINERTDLGAEVMFVASKSSADDRIRLSFLMAAFQYRPWRTNGFFLKAGAGMALVHNWILNLDNQTPSFRSKAFALAIGTGWEWSMGKHFGAQAIATHHAAALGDLQTSTSTVENVMGNLWSVGGTIVIR
jgi:hypothetical protein